MIDASELRIGNLVDNCGQWCFVMSIYKNNKVELGYFKDSISFVRSLDNQGIKPIPLTEQWLIDFGFKNTQIGLFQIKVLSRGSINIHTNRRDIKFVELGTTGHYLFGVVDVKFVHQLQNVYFAITGEELKIKIRE